MRTATGDRLMIMTTLSLGRPPQ